MLFIWVSYIYSIMINWQAHITTHFTLKEAKCPDCELIILVPELLIRLEALRTEFGHAIRPTSWTRCPAHNAAVGGSAKSYHMNGHAVDIQPYENGLLYQLETIARKHFPFILPYQYHIHCDIRGKRP